MLAELERCGIQEPARSQLAALEHVTVERIRGHCEHSDNTGLAIYRLRHNWDVPARWRREAEGASLPSAPLSNALAEDTSLPREVDDWEAEDEAPEEPPAPVDDGCRKAWEAALGRLRSEITPGAYHTWAANARLARVQGDTWTIHVGNKLCVEQFARGGWPGRLSALLREDLGRPIRVQVEVGYEVYGAGREDAGGEGP